MYDFIVYASARAGAKKGKGDGRYLHWSHVRIPLSPFLLYACVNLVEGVRVARLKYVSNAGFVDEKN